MATTTMGWREQGYESGAAAAAEMIRERRPRTAAEWEAAAAALRAPGLPSASGWAGELPAEGDERAAALAEIRRGERTGLDDAADAAAARRRAGR